MIVNPMKFRIKMIESEFLWIEFEKNRNLTVMNRAESRIES